MSDSGSRDHGRCDLDRLREYVEGSLGPDETPSLLARVDAADEEFLHALRDVAAVLPRPEFDTDGCRVTFEDLERRIDREVAASRPRLPWMRVAAAALLLVAAGAWAGIQTMRPRDPETVHLTDLAAAPAPARADRGGEAALAVARVLARHVPTVEGELAWFASFHEARDVARVTGRPILLFLSHPVCPVCAELEAGPLADPVVRARIGQFVPTRVRASFDAPDPDFDRDWPYFAVMSSEGIILADLPVPASTQEFLAFLDDQIERRIPGTAPSWERVRELARRLDDAASADDPRRSEALLDALATEPAAQPFDAAAQALLVRRVDRARETLRDAAVASATSSDAAQVRVLLESASVRYAGTRFARDFAAVLAAYRATGRFPLLEPPVLEASAADLAR